MASPTVDKPQNEEKLSYMQKVWRYRHYLVIEPFFFFYLMASVFNIIAMLNFPLDKACRVNLGYSPEVCATTLDKSAYDIDCDTLNFEDTVDFTASEAEKTFTDMSPGFNVTVCKAEIGAQKLAANVSGKRAPIAAIFPLIVMLFAGGWSDRYNKRKACMIAPLIGESLMFLCLLASAIFFDKIPMEFGAYSEAIVPALFGGNTLCLMAIDSYMTISTPEEDRIFRFGIFAMFTTGLPFIGQPISGVLFNYLGYTWSFTMAFSFNVIALLYVIFIIKELKPLPSKTSDSAIEAKSHTSGTENPAYDGTQLDELQTTPRNVALNNNAAAPEKRNVFKDFFDPSLVVDYVKFPLKKRPNRGRMLLLFLMMAYMFTIGPGLGENDFWNRFTFRKLNWNGNDFSVYSTVTSALVLAGTFIGTAILSKLLKLSDALVGFVSALTTACSRVLFAFSSNTATFYAGGVADSFATLRVIAIKTIGSSIVDGEDLSKMFSIFSICQPIAQLVFIPIYSDIYEKTVDSFPGAIFLFSEVFAIPNIIVFIICYIVVRRRKAQIKREEAEAQQNGQNGRNDNRFPVDSEITSL
ncbi:solute carrier family 46 member 2 [Haematobia irritans]|uniref:solute carrier family 46 member 2 n=1 Tax=Haematobia irritans TaxID=7368 RepID=UPI003F50D422